MIAVDDYIGTLLILMFTAPRKRGDGLIKSFDLSILGINSLTVHQTHLTNLFVCCTEEMMVLELFFPPRIRGGSSDNRVNCALNKVMRPE